MKIGIFSDIHGNSPALKAVLPVLLEEVDQIIFLGDLCGYYPFVDECVALWDENRITGICGNHDKVLLDCLQNGTGPSSDYQARYGSALMRSLRSLSAESISLLQSFPVSRMLTLDGIVLALYHGAPWNHLEGRVYPDYGTWDRFSDISADIILLGHTHYPFSRRHRNKLIINPGSVGQPRDRDPRACYAVLDLASKTVQHFRVPFDPRELIEDATTHDPDLKYLTEVLTRI